MEQTPGSHLASFLQVCNSNIAGTFIKIVYNTVFQIVFTFCHLFCSLSCLLFLSALQLFFGKVFFFLNNTTAHYLRKIKSKKLYIVYTVYRWSVKLIQNHKKATSTHPSALHITMLIVLPSETPPNFLAKWGGMFSVDNHMAVITE